MSYSYVPSNREKRKDVKGIRFRDSFNSEKENKARKLDKKKYYREEE
jgi:hypothetical protein